MNTIELFGVTYQVHDNAILLPGCVAKMFSIVSGGVSTRWIQARPLLSVLTGAGKYNTAKYFRERINIQEEDMKSLDTILPKESLALVDHNTRVSFFVNETALQRCSLQKKRKAETSQDSLYVARYPWRSDILKIGRSENPEARMKQLTASHAFEMQLLAVFPGQGGIESKVHEAFAHRRNDEGGGREWFHITLAEATSVISPLVTSEDCPSSASSDM